MNRPWRPLKKLPHILDDFRKNLDTVKFQSVNLYFQDESRFGLMTHVGKCLTSIGVKPITTYKHAFKSTYLYGSFSPITGDAFIYEIEGTTSEIFYKYLLEFSKHKPKELKVIIIDNAGFHSLKQYKLPENIKLIRIPPYTPELNPAEKIWHYIKQYFKNKAFDDLQKLKEWLHNFINENLGNEIVKSITHNKFFIEAFMSSFEI